jgi:hypothetical protein
VAVVVVAVIVVVAVVVEVLVEEDVVLLVAVEVSVEADVVLHEDEEELAVDVEVPGVVLRCLLSPTDIKEFSSAEERRMSC